MSVPESSPDFKSVPIWDRCRGVSTPPETRGQSPISHACLGHKHLRANPGYESFLLFP
jgi:hypothetical protein